MTTPLEHERLPTVTEPNPIFTQREERPSNKEGRQRVENVIIQVALLIAFLAAWQLLPTIEWFSSRSKFLDRFYISSPSQVVQTLWDLMTASNGRPSLWPYLWTTVSAALLGTAIGTTIGAVAGMWLSNSPRAGAILQPFIVGLNAVPRIAIIPIFVILFGPARTTSVVTTVTVVFFLVFFNAYEGGRSVPKETVQNVTLLGAGRRQAMYRVRWPYVVAWTITTLPNAVSFGLLIVVATEILAGIAGMGRLLSDAAVSLQPDLTFAVVVALSILGIILVGITELARKRLLHWWDQEA